VLECRVYAKHKTGSYDFIGGTKDTIRSLLNEGAAGSMYMLMLNFSANERQLSIASYAKM
jgi:hypothetical protein